MSPSSSGSEPRPASRRLGELLSESVESARRRERRFAAILDGASGRPIVLAGAGGLGRRIGEQLIRCGARVVAYVDNDPARQGMTLLGVPVLAAEEAARRHGREALFVVTIWNYGHSFKTTYRQLTSLGCATVEPWVPVAWALGDTLLPQYAAGLPSAVLEAREDVLSQSEVWADARSAEVYANQVAWRLTGELGDLEDPEDDQYFPRDVVALRPGEAFVDCGAFDGDSVVEFVRRAPDFSAIHAFEPDPDSFAALERTVQGLDRGAQGRIHLHRLATGSAPGMVEFVIGAGASGRISHDGLSTSGAATAQVPVTRLDDLLRTEPVTFIKLDVEGAEAATLLGAANLIRARRPVLAVSAYHLQSDLWELPKLLRSLTEDYLLFLRPHRPDSFDCVLYGIPAERSV